MSAGDSTETRARLLEAGRAVYLEGGAAAFSLREVARRVGVSAPAVYRHFENKEALLAAVCEEGFRTFGTYLMRSLAAKTPLERLRSCGTYYLRFALERPFDYRVIFMSELIALGFTEKIPSDHESASTFLFLVDRVRECIAAKVFAPGDEMEIAAMIWAHVHGLASLRLAGRLVPVGDDAAFAKFFERSVDRFLTSFTP